VLIEERDDLIRLYESQKDQLKRELFALDAELATRFEQVQELQQQLAKQQQQLVHLTPLEVSPKRQLAALRHSVPSSVSKRIRPDRDPTPQ